MKWFRTSILSPSSPIQFYLPRRSISYLALKVIFPTEIRNRRLQQEALQHLVQLLPTPNRETLWALLNFLNVVAANSEDQKNERGEWVAGNKMDTTNLATVSGFETVESKFSFLNGLKGTAL